MHNKKSGFTLPEALVTIAILGSVILYFILALTVGKYAAQLSRDRAIISNLLRGEVENILASNYPLQEAAKGSQTIIVNDGLRNIPVTKTLDFTTEDSGVYGYQKVYICMEWMGGITRNQTLREDSVFYFTKE